MRKTRSAQKLIREAEAELSLFDEMGKDALRGYSDAAAWQENLRRAEYYIRQLAKTLPGIIKFVREYNDDPARKEFGLSDLDPNMGPTQLLAVIRERQQASKVPNRRAVRRRNIRAERNALEFKLMDAHIASGKSKNEAARLTRDMARGRKESTTALLKRYRKHLAAKSGVDKASP